MEPTVYKGTYGLKQYFIVLAIFLATFGIVLPQLSGTNPRARLALMGNLCQKAPSFQGFDLGPYSTWTIDWAQTPNGKKYSNKAPGPSLVGTPVFCLISRLIIGGDLTGTSRASEELDSIYAFDNFISILFQILPFVFSLYYLTLVLTKKNIVFRTQTPLALVAAILGTSATIFMNSYFGHAFSAWIWILCAGLLLNSQFYWLGFFLGFSFFSDYAALFAFPAFFVGLYLHCKESSLPLLKSLGRILVGSVPMILLFGFYHWHSFGAPWTLPQKYQNPEFLDLANQEDALWGVIHLYPKMEVVFQLFFSFQRGLLWSQPWVLFVLVWILHTIIKTKKLSSVNAIVLFSFLGFLFFNSSFGAWHGGGSSGPRYLSPILPLFCLPLIFQHHELPKYLKQLLLFLILYSVLFQIMALSTTIIARHDANLILTFIKIFKNRLGTCALRFLICITFLLTWFFCIHKKRRHVFSI